MSQVKRALRKCVNLLGFEIQRCDRAIRRKELRPRGFSLEACMTGLLAAKGHISVVEIGANDGIGSDPVYGFLHRYSDSSSVVLIEPQEDLIPILRDNYKAHPHAVVISSAVGEPGEARLFSIDKEVWPELRVPYAKNWPIYRAPTGVTSLSKEHVKKWLMNITKKSPNEVETMIVEQTIQTHPLETILSKNSIQGTVDVLQVDTEGHDDIVLYNSLGGHVCPAIVNFEYRNLASNRVAKCVDWLENQGYECFRGWVDMLCVKTRVCQ